ncbi:ABC-2 type transport system permease protein [Amycolatopsis lurida]|uniref:Membrane protein n=1 Tax=Amycolatopsis lurida NRRL 2430 TaxID=1460371 RepID=A0A2P2G0W5_AMYLU|nr:ABC transporter permease subunit [Amycolatopsis lurida]KFU82621.1 membrane protein [Amycolatopsis lurida NRRL 2430]SEE08157.1 ABC-2 type transport system permease protein [Amycolatopsis lurida]
MTHALAAAPAARTGQDSVGLLRLYRAELRWIFRRPRTLAVLGLLALIPVIIGVALTLVDPAETSGGGGGDGDGALLASAVSNGFILPVAALTMTLGLLLPLASAMAGADAIAGEAAHGTLRGWLIAPVGRGRLLAIKAFGVATVSTIAVLAMTFTGFVTGLVISGTDSMFTLTGSTLSVWDALGRILLVAAWVVLQLWAVGAVALAISAFTEHPMLVVASVLAGTIVFTILGFLDAVSWLHPFLLNENWTQAPASVLMDPVDTAMLGEGALRAACYIAIGLSIAYARLTTRDG